MVFQVLLATQFCIDSFYIKSIMSKQRYH